tara:strand:- start:212 stop:448 length:237 start_codon:yes stop_codon:yes gene_type:complete
MLAGREGGSSLSPFASDMLRLQSLIRYAPYVVKLVFHSDPLIEINIKLDIIRENVDPGAKRFTARAVITVSGKPGEKA